MLHKSVKNTQQKFLTLFRDNHHRSRVCPHFKIPPQSDRIFSGEKPQSCLGSPLQLTPGGSQHKGLPCRMLLAQVRPKFAPSRSRSESLSRPRQVVRGLMRPYRPPKVIARGQPMQSRTTSQIKHQKQEPQLAILDFSRVGFWTKCAPDLLVAAPFSLLGPDGDSPEMLCEQQ